MTPTPNKPIAPQSRALFAAELVAIHHVLDHLKNGRASNQEMREKTAQPAQDAIVNMLNRAGYDVNPATLELTDRYTPTPIVQENPPALPTEAETKVAEAAKAEAEQRAAADKAHKVQLAQIDVMKAQQAKKNAVPPQADYKE